MMQEILRHSPYENLLFLMSLKKELTSNQMKLRMNNQTQDPVTTPWLDPSGEQEQEQEDKKTEDLTPTEPEGDADAEPAVGLDVEETPTKNINKVDVDVVEHENAYTVKSSVEGALNSEMQYVVTWSAGESGSGGNHNQDNGSYANWEKQLWNNQKR